MHYHAPVIEYNGFAYSIPKDHGSYIYKVFVPKDMGNPKFKWRVIHSKVGIATRGKKGGLRRDQWGNVLYTPFESKEQAEQKAKEYIDEWLVTGKKWANKSVSSNERPFFAPSGSEWDDYAWSGSDF